MSWLLMISALLTMRLVITFNVLSLTAAISNCLKGAGAQVKSHDKAQKEVKPEPMKNVVIFN